MEKAGIHIPIHDFEPENDLGSVGLRYVPLETRNNYDFSKPHRHAYFEVFIFRKGGGKHQIDFVEHTVADRSIHIVRPGQVHLLQRTPDSHGAVLHFPNDTIIHFGKAAGVLLRERCNIFVFNKESFNTISTLLGMLQQELSLSAQPEEIPIGYLNLMLVKAAHSATETVHLPGDAEHFRTFCALVEEHYREGRTPAWYANKIFITEKKLNTACKIATGNTVSSYIKERLVLETKRLLSYSSGSIKEIGYYLGFEDPAYFNRFFRRNAGITAGEFREKCKQQ